MYSLLRYRISGLCLSTTVGILYSTYSLNVHGISQPGMLMKKVVSVRAHTGTFQQCMHQSCYESYL